MTKANKNILHSGESETVEFKKSLSENEQILETISAFSNSHGGSIYVGIDDAGTVTGVQIGKKTLETLANDIKMATDPKVFPSIETVDFSRQVESSTGKKVIHISVIESPIKPVWIHDKVFERVGKTNQRVPAERIRQLVKESQPFQWDQQIVRKASLSEVEHKKVKEFLQRAEEERNTEFESSRSVTVALSKLRLQEKNKPTAAAILLFGKNPQRWFPQSEVRCARFRGTEAIDFDDMFVIRGTLIQQVNEVLQFIRKHINVSARITGSPAREEVWDVPKEALREAVVNAICHRDYEDTGNVQVRILDDRIEIWNPGILPKGLTIADLKSEHRSQPRNILVAENFYLIKYLEQWGTGTNRMIRLCKEAGIPDPVFTEKAGSFVVTFTIGKNKLGKEKTELPLRLNETQKKIIKLLQENANGLKPSELGEMLSIDRRSVQRNMVGIKDFVTWTGASVKDPNGRYALKKTSQ